MAKTEAEIAELLRQYRGKTGELLSIGTAESATGGRVAGRLTDVTGSSDYFKGCVVAYSNEVKTGVLGVKSDTIENDGAVSEQTAIEMAEGGRRLLGVDVCISDTGIAGPTGSKPGKPLGLFYFGLATKQVSRSQQRVFHGDRYRNRRDATETALNMLKQYLQQCLSQE